MRKYEAYSDSKIGWISDMPNHWRLKPLKYLVGCNDEVLSEKTEPDKLIKYIEIGDVSADNGINEPLTYQFSKAPSRARRIVRSGDVIISTVRTYLKAISSIDETFNGYIASTGFAVLRPKVIESRFLGYTALADGLIGEIISLSKGVSYPSITAQDLMNIKVPLPSVEEQTQIANYLDHKTTQIDDLIKKKEKLIELLKEERVAIINQAVTKGLNPNVPMKDSGIEWLGEIPEHWEVKKLKYIFDNRNSVRIPLSAEERGKMEVKKFDYYGASGVIDQVEDYLFEGDNILIGEDGANLLTRSKRLAFIASGKYWVNNHAHIIHPKTSNIYYMCELLEMIDYTIWVTGSAQPKLTQEALMNIHLIEPPKIEQDEITDYLKEKIEAIYKVKGNYSREIELLKEYKTALISEVVTGKVDVRNEKIN